MPTICDQAPILYPESAIAIQEIPGPWHVVLTLSRREKRLGCLLAAANIPYFLPQEASIVKLAGKRRTIWRLLFPGYVFLAGGPDSLDAAMRSRCVAQLLPVINQRLLVRELSDLHTVLCAGGQLLACRMPSEGEPVCVVDGPFEGVQGIVVRRDAKHARLVLQVTTIGASVELEVDASAIAAL